MNIYRIQKIIKNCNSEIYSQLYEVGKFLKIRDICDLYLEKKLVTNKILLFKI